jgi:hypothetical protein
MMKSIDKTMLKELKLAGPGGGFLFLDQVVIPLMDEKKDGVIELDELHK